MKGILMGIITQVVCKGRGEYVYDSNFGEGEVRLKTTIASLISKVICVYAKLVR